MLFNKNSNYMNKIYTTLKKVILILIGVIGTIAYSFGQVNLTATGGTPSGSFANVNAAFAAINSGTHQGMITITVNGNTSEPTTPVQLLRSGSGSSNYMSITIVPSGNVTINSNATPTASRGILEFVGADNVTIDGDDPLTGGTQNLSIVAATSANAGIACLRFSSSSSTADGCTNISVKNCNITGARNLSTSTTTSFGIFCGISAAASTITTVSGAYGNNNMTFENNVITRAYYGIYSYGLLTSNAFCSNNLIIRNNTIGSATNANNIGLRGIYLAYTQLTNTSSSAIIEGNDIRGGENSATGLSTSPGGIEISSGNAGVQIRKNKIHDITNFSTLGWGAYGIHLSSATSTSDVHIYNNYIWNMQAFHYSSFGTYNAHGIYSISAITNLRINNNSISLQATNAFSGAKTNNFSTCIYLSNTTAGFVTELKNNILVNKQADSTTQFIYCIYAGASTIFASGALNNNAYQVGGTTVGYGNASGYIGRIGTTNYQSLASWKTATGQEGNGFIETMPFTSSTNLKIPNATASQLESGGATISGISSDIEGDVRPGPFGSTNGGGTSFDIGADEFDGIPSDLTAPLIVHTAVLNTANTGNRTITATITDNSGLLGIGTNGAPRIYYKKFFAGTWFSDTLSAKSGSSYDFTIKASTLGGLSSNDSVYYYIAAQDRASTPNMATSPAGGAGINPPGSTRPTTVNSYKILPTISGTYYVGTSGTCNGSSVTNTYATLTAAIAAYNSNGLNGNVDFVLTDAAYNTTTSETFPMVINANGDASASKVLTISPCANLQTTISGSSTTGLIKFNATTFTTIRGNDGSNSSNNLTIQNTSTSTGTTTLWLSSNSTTSYCTDITIKDVNIYNGGNFSNYCVMVSGTSVTAQGDNNRNILLDGDTLSFAGQPVYLNGTPANKITNVEIKNCNIGSYNPALPFFSEGFVLNNTIAVKFHHNEIQNMRVSAAFGGSGVGIGSSSLATEIYNNNIHDLKSTSAGYGIYGIKISSGGGNDSTKVYNNMIYDLNSNNTATTVTGNIPSGIRIEGSGFHKIYNNSVYLSGVSTSATAGASSAALHITATGLNNLDIRNNIFVNNMTNSGNTANSNAALSLPSSTTSNYANWTMDKNDYYAPSVCGLYAYVGGVLCPTKLNLVTYTNKDSNSYSRDPQYVSTTNLHINAGTNKCIAENSGDIVSLFNTDYDNQTRPDNNAAANGGGTTFDIGADEYDGVPEDSFYVSTLTPTQPYVTAVTANNRKQAIMRVAVKIQGVYKGFNITSFTFNTNGTSQASTNLDSAKLYYAGLTGAIDTSAASLFGGVASPNGSFTINGSFRIFHDTTFYFNLFYDIKNTAVVGDSVDAQLVSINGNSVVNFGGGATSGNRKITGPMCGTYTVGSGQNYATITDAITDLTTRGTSCGVTLSLTDNAYASETFPLTLNQFAGISAANRLVIKPATGATPVIAGSSATGILRLNGADYVTIDGSNTVGGTTQDLTISNTYNTGASAAIYIISQGTGAGATNNTIKNCKIAAGNITSGYSAIQLGGSTNLSSGDDNDNDTIQNCILTKAYYGVYSRSAVTGTTDNLGIIGNTIGSNTATDYITFKGISVGQAIGVLISQNTIFNLKTTSGSPGPSGIEIAAGTNNVKISRNKITGLYYTSTTGYGAIGIDINSTGFTTGTGSIVIDNNMISDINGDGWTSVSNGIPCGLRVQGVNDGIKFVYNSINLNGTNNNSTAARTNYVSACIAFGSNTNTNLDFRNNIFRNTYSYTGGSYTGAKHYGVMFLTATFPTSNFTNFSNNNFDTTGYGTITGNTPKYFGLGATAGSLTEYATVSTLQAGYGLNTSTIEVSSGFTSNTDLHTGVNALNGTAATGTGITIDFDGQTRNASTPDIGADEFTPVNDDAGITSISAGSGAICAGSINLNATIKNYGVNNLTSDSVYWSVNGTLQGGVLWTGNIAQGSTSTVSLGSYSFSSGTTYTIKAWSSSPNNIYDPNLTNDSNTLNNVKTGLNGTYTVGTGGNYTTLTAAVADLNQNGACGAVTFNLTDATYSNSETFPIIINQYSGSSSTNKLTIKPASGNTATITGSALGIIVLNGADYVTIDGSNNGGTSRDLSITNNSVTTTSSVIFMASLGTGAGATNNTIKNVNITAGLLTTAVSGITIGDATSSTTAGGDNDNDTIRNCSFNKCYYGIYQRGTATAKSDNLGIIGNSFGSNTASNYVGFKGISLGQANGVLISQNTIFNIKTTSGSPGPIGIEMTIGTNNVRITRNTITGLYYTGSSGYGATGIDINATGFTAGTGNIQIDNNMLSDLNGDGWTSVSNGIPCGIRIQGVNDGIKLYYNSISLSGTNNLKTSASANYFSACVAFGSNTNTNLDFRNNSFKNTFTYTGGAYTGAKHYGILLYAATFPSSNFTNLSNNNFDTTSYGTITGNTPKFLGLGSTAGSLTEYGTLAAMQAGYGLNNNSRSSFSNYASSSDLHSSGIGLNKGATPISITTDFDGETRDASTPDIGADEFYVNSEDAGVFRLIPNSNVCQGDSNLYSIRIKNYGENFLTSDSVYVSVNGTLIGGTSWTGNLVKNDSATISLGYFAWPVSGSYLVKIWSTKPNGIADQTPSNDTLTQVIVVNPKPIASYNLNNAAQCISGNNFIYTNTSSNANTYKWNFGTGVNDTSTAVNPIKTYLALGTYTVKMVAMSSFGCVSDTNISTISISPNGWNGSMDTSWFNGANWCSGVVPNSTTDIIIPAGLTNYPSIQSSAICRNLIIASGASVKMVSGGSLTINGTFTQNGTFLHSIGYLNLANSTSIPAGTYFAVRLTGVAKSYSLLGNVTINNTFEISSSTSTLSLGSNNLTLKGDVTMNGIISGNGKTLFTRASGYQTLFSNGLMSNVELNTSASGGVRIIGNLLVTNSLFLTSGTCLLNPATTLTIGTTSTSIGNIITTGGNILGGNSATTNELIINGNASAPQITNLKYSSNGSFTLNRPNGVKLGDRMLVGNTTSLYNGVIDMNGFNFQIGSTSLAYGIVNTTSGKIKNSQATGILSIIGNASAPFISGLPLDTMRNITINRASGLSIANSFVLNGTATLTIGDVDLNGATITLGSAATISEAANQTFVGNSGSLTTTRSYATALSNNNIAGLGMKLSTNAAPGNTTITRKHNVYTSGTGSSISRNYDITVANNVTASVFEMTYDSTELAGADRSKLRFNKSTNNGSTWSNITGCTPSTANASTGAVRRNGTTLSGTIKFTVSDSANTPLSPVFVNNNQVNSNIEYSSQLMVYPNPFNKEFTIDMNVSAGKYTIMLTDLNGKVIINQNIETTEGNILMVIPSESLSKGVYILNIVGNDFKQTTKVVKY